MHSFTKFESYGLDGSSDARRSGLEALQDSGLIPENTPLLPKTNSPHHLPIFLRVCHSPWRFIRQETLAVLRTVVALYLTFILVINLLYDILYVENGELVFFKAGTVSLAVQVTFYWVSTIWTFHHLLTPHQRRIDDDEEESPGFWSNFGELFGPPKTTEPDSKRRLAFSSFYSAAVTFPFLVTSIYWLVLFDPQQVGSSVVRRFIIANVYGATAFVALFEILILNGVHRQRPFTQHAQTILATTVVYLIWTVFGKLITDKYVYQFLDPNYAGWRAVVSNDLALLSFTLTAFSFQRGLHGIREKAVSRAERA